MQYPKDEEKNAFVQSNPLPLELAQGSCASVGLLKNIIKHFCVTFRGDRQAHQFVPPSLYQYEN